MLFIAPMYDINASPLMPRDQGFFLGKVNVSMAMAVQNIMRAQTGLYCMWVSCRPVQKFRAIVVVAKSKMTPPRARRNGSIQGFIAMLGFSPGIQFTDMYFKYVLLILKRFRRCRILEVRRTAEGTLCLFRWS